MTRLNKPADPVKPSAPDPVDAWLDVLVAILSIPKPDRQRVRDELEDHLRSRIDDLLIHGLTEPQALQKAVAELGETADLARQLSHAHKPPRTRRYAMHALIIALAGTVVALGVNTMRPATTLPAMAASSNALDAVIEPTLGGQVAVPSTSGELMTATVHVPVGGQVSVEEILQRFASKFHLTLELDREALSRLNIGTDSVITFPAVHPSSESLAGILRRIQEESGHAFRSIAQESRLAASIIDGALVVTSRHELDVQTTERRVYALGRFSGDLADPYDQQIELVQVVDALMEHVTPYFWRDRGGDMAMATLLGSSLIVTAPVRVHEQVESLLDDLHAQAVDQAEQRQAAEAARRGVAAREHGQLVGQIRTEYERALSEKIDMTEQVERLEVDYHRQNSAIVMLPAENKAETSKPIYAEIERIMTQIRSLRTRLEEATARVDYLRTRMIEIEYEPLVSARNPKAASNPHVTPGVVTVRGQGLREGIYQVVNGMTIRRMLMSAGALEAQRTGTVQLIRDDDVVREWSFHDAMSKPHGDTILLPGDTLAIVP